ncbi:MAG: FAD-dependent oxidoreductase [Candidatus Sumerlaeia bacterium]|nr:FAD-dependent oxidoreductase [Candidatus Sumerlaeia bacterium]
MQIRIFSMIGLLAFCFSLWCTGAAAATAPAVVWLEAEQFADCGGWSNDSQFVAQMGSPYLLATGLGKPVKDAVTKARIPAPGEYRLWVRCKDWYPDDSPGQFQVIIAGRPSKTTFGKAKTSEWQWTDGGMFNIRSAEVEVRLHDLTGWWGRCDALVLTADPSFRPSDNPDELARQRETFGGVAREIQQPGPYDVVVVGGGLAGTASAIAAARMGCRTALIQDRPVLGGNASVEINVPPQGDTTREPLDPGETGIIEEFDPRGPRHADWSTPMEKVVRAQQNLDLFLNTRATGVVMKDKTTIDAVEAIDVRKGTRYRFAGRMFVDATGDGWIGFWAGAEHRHGSEGREEYGESIAAEPSRQTMGNTIYKMEFRTHDKPVPFTAPAWAYKWTSPDDFDKDPVSPIRTSGERPKNFDDLTKGRGREPRTANAGAFEWWVELGGMYDTIADAEWIRDELFRINIGLWDYAKNYNPKTIEENRNRELVWMNYVPGTRESRRLLGDYVLTQKDFEQKTVHPDTVAYCGWGTDIHHPWGFFAKGNEYYTGFHHKQSIPYRSLYSRNISNLLMAGRDISVSHIALGSVRVMRTCCIVGQAAGTAAALACQLYTTPRGLYEKHLNRLQDQLLKDGMYLMGRPNADPNDLARTAKATASSVAVIPNPALSAQAKTAVNGGLVHELTTPRAVMFTAKGKDAVPVNLESVSLFLRSTLTRPATIRAVLRPAKQLGDFSSKTNLAEAEGTVPPQSTGWVEFKLSAKLEPGKVYYIALPETRGLSWDLYPSEPPGTTRAYGGPNWKPMYGCYRFKLNPGGEPEGSSGVPPAAGVGPDTRSAPPATVRLEPANVINGWNRAVGGVPNSWGPDPKAPLPQWVELDFGKPVKFNSVHVTFQLPTLAAAAYKINTSVGGKEWKTVASVTDNRQRRRVHEFEPVTADRLRLVIEDNSTSGTTPQVCEIRVYDETGK